VLYLFDYIYRGVHTIRLINKFIGKSVVKLPTVDMRTDVQGGVMSEYMSYLQYGFELLPYVYVQLLMIGAFIGFCAWVIVALYIPG
jgi:hypothetical protein